MIGFEGSCKNMNVLVASQSGPKCIFNRIFRQISQLPTLPLQTPGAQLRLIHNEAADEIFDKEHRS